MTEMSAKRSATTELNHDNWNEENEPEEAGTFAKATNDILEKRVIKTARRRLPSTRDDDNMKKIFGTLSSFKTIPATNSSPFSFLANTTTSNTTTSVTPATTVNVSGKNTATNGASNTIENDANKKESIAEVKILSSTSSSKKASTEKGNEKTKSHSSDYYAELKGLNESVATWIKTHVDENPFCILTPVFRDYERYLKEITLKEESTKSKTLHTLEHTIQVAQKDKQNISIEKKSESPTFGNASANTKSLTTGSEWKPEKSIFSNITANTKLIFGNAEQKTETSKSVFGNTDVISDKSRSIFGNIESNVAGKSIFGNVSTENNPFLHKSTISDGKKTDEEEAKTNMKSVAPTFPTTTFSFGQSSTTSNMTAGFSFGSSKPFSFASQAVKPQDSEDKTENENKDEEDEEPPKPDFKPVTEEGAIYEQRCKVYVKKDSNFTDRGVGTLYLKPTPNGKTQLIVRADTALGNLLLNTLLTESIPTKRMNKNNIMLVCLPMPDSLPPPVAVLLRVKTSEVADELLEIMNKHKK